MEDGTISGRSKEPPEAAGKCRCSGCPGCGQCCGKAAPEYVVISSFVWPPWPEKPEENRDPEGG